MALRLQSFARTFRVIGCRSMSGEGVGKGGGAGGVIREAGGTFGKIEAAREEEYIRKLQKKQLEEMKKYLDEQVEYHAKEIEEHKNAKQLQEIKNHLDEEVEHHEKIIKQHQEAIERHKKKIKQIEKGTDSD